MTALGCSKVPSNRLAAEYDILYETASRIGSLAAHSGWVVLTGGGPGVMAAACRGAVSAAGLTVGIVPFERPTTAYPNQWVRLPIYTGAGMARNAFNVLSATLCVALGGGAGTLSEIALALKAGVEIWCYRSWRLEPPASTRGAGQPRLFTDDDKLLSALQKRFRAGASSPTP